MFKIFLMKKPNADYAPSAHEFCRFASRASRPSTLSINAANPFGARMKSTGKSSVRYFVAGFCLIFGGTVLADEYARGYDPHDSRPYQNAHHILDLALKLIGDAADNLESPQLTRERIADIKDAITQVERREDMLFRQEEDSHRAFSCEKESGHVRLNVYHPFFRDYDTRTALAEVWSAEVAKRIADEVSRIWGFDDSQGIDFASKLRVRRTDGTTTAAFTDIFALAATEPLSILSSLAATKGDPITLADVAAMGDTGETTSRYKCIAQTMDGKDIFLGARIALIERPKPEGEEREDTGVALRTALSRKIAPPRFWVLKGEVGGTDLLNQEIFRETRIQWKDEKWRLPKWNSIAYPTVQERIISQDMAGGRREFFIKRVGPFYSFKVLRLTDPQIVGYCFPR